RRTRSTDATTRAAARGTAPVMSAPAPPAGGGPPDHWERDVVLVDGGTVHVRPIAPGDADRLVAFHAGLSEQTVYFRYFSAKPVLSEQQAQHFTTVDHHDRVALVAELGDRLVAVAR